MKGIIAKTYPTRYTAFDNPKTWVEAADLSVKDGGYEYAVYYEPMANREYPHITDGIYCEIVSYQGIDYLVNCSYTIPDKSREQGGVSKRFKDYHEARKFAQNWIPKAQEMIKAKLVGAL